jgi:hypothetical protein
VRRKRRRELHDARQEAGVAHQLRGDAVIGMTPDRRRRDDDRGPQPTQHLHECGARLLRVLDVRVGQGEVLAYREPEHPRGRLRLRGSQLGRSARSHLALREIQHARAMALRGRPDQRAPTGELHVVPVRTDGQHGERRRRRATCPLVG